MQIFPKKQRDCLSVNVIDHTEKRPIGELAGYWDWSKDEFIHKQPIKKPQRKS